MSVVQQQVRHGAHGNPAGGGAFPPATEAIGDEHAEQIDLVLTDVVMPEMSGLELSMRLRAARPGLQVMYMSGFPEPLVGDGTTEAPGAHFISKPFNRPALLQCVRRALDAVAKTHST